MRLSRRVAAATAVAVIALMMMLLPTQAFLGVDQFNDTGANGAAVIDQEPAQSFTPTYGSLGAVDIFLLSWVDGPTVNAFTLEVEIFTGGGTFIGQSNVPISIGFTGGVVQAQFSPPLALVPGDTYVIALNTPDGDSFENQLRWQFVQQPPSGPYGGGGATLDYNSAVPFVATQTYDFMFRTYLDDVTPPVVTPVITPPSATAPWWNTDVNLTWTVVENDSPVTLTGCATQNILLDQPVTTYTCQATSVGGASAVVSVDIGRDTVKPVITAIRTPAVVNGWNTSAVAVTFDCTDENSGIATDISGAPINKTDEGAGQSVSSSEAGTCIDNAGNVADIVTVADINIDLTAPVVTMTVIAGQEGDNSWYITDPTIRTTGTDLVSPVVSCSPDFTQTTNTLAVGANIPGTCTNAAGLVGNAVFNVKLDKLAPTVSLTPSGTLGANGWYTSNVNVTTSAVELHSGIESCTPVQPFTNESPQFFVNGSCTDNAGNVGNAPQLELKIDKSGPTAVTIAVVDGQLGNAGWYRTDVTIRTTGTDNVSGVTCDPDQFLTSDTGPTGTNFTGDCTNGAGLSTVATPNPLNVKLDESAPTVTLQIVGGTLGNNGWYRSDVVVRTNGADVGASGIASCTPDQTFTAESGGFNVSGSCIDVAGNVGHGTPLGLKIDKTAPVTTVAPISPFTTPNGANGWFITGPVILDTSGTDALSGIIDANCTANQTFSVETAGTTVNGTCVDNAGNSSSNSYLLKLDTTAPVASMVVTGGHLGLNGWYVVAPIVATAFGTDDVSGPVTCDPMLQSLATETLSTTLTATCENQAGLTSNASVTVKIDLTAPVTTIAASAAPDGDNGWYVTNPTLVTTGVEDMSNPIVCTDPQVISTETTGIDVLGTCTNSAGLSSTDTETIKLDKTPPTLVVTMPAAVQLNAAVSAVPTATDATSGVASATCDPVATNVLGTFEVTCTAEDNAGNITTVTVEYQVLSTAVGSGDCGKVLFGTLPPAGGGYGTFAFSCGSLEQLLTASGCPQSTAVFFYNLPGRFVVYIPGTTVSAANTEFLSIFNGDPRIPVNTIFTAKCR